MVTIVPAAPLDGPALLPDALVDQYVKPDETQAALIAAFRLTALGWVERHTRHSLQRRSWRATFERYVDGIPLPVQPVRSVTSVLYTIAGSTVGAAVVTFEAGYDDLATEAPALQIAALMMVKHLFDGGSLDDVPATVSLLLDEQYRTPVIG